MWKRGFVDLTSDSDEEKGKDAEKITSPSATKRTKRSRSPSPSSQKKEAKEERKSEEESSSSMHGIKSSIKAAASSVVKASSSPKSQSKSPIASPSVPAASPARSLSSSAATSFSGRPFRPLPPPWTIAQNYIDPSLPNHTSDRFRTITNAGNAVSLRDLLQSGSGERIESIALGTYVFDLEWLQKEAGVLNRVPVHLSHGLKEYPHKSVANFTLYIPPLPMPFGTVHSKYALVYFPHKVRVCIFTANLEPTDWQAKIQLIWTQEFPLKKSVSSTSSFGTILIDYFKHCKLQGQVEKLEKYDFSSAAAHLITSVPGTHRGAQTKQYGHLRVREVLKKMGASADAAEQEKYKHSRPICTFSSVGSLTDAWLNQEFTQSLCAAPHVHSLPSPQVVWPTFEAVQQSVFGFQGADHLCLSEKNANAVFKAHLFKYESPVGRQGLLSHAKAYTRVHKTSSSTNQDYEMQYVMMTSSNLSKAAWGTASKDLSSITIRSWEMGVLLEPSLLKSVYRSGAASSSSAASSPIKFRSLYEYVMMNDDGDVSAASSLSIHDSPSDVIDIPFPCDLRPMKLKPYERADVDVPFTVDGTWEIPDSQGVFLRNGSLLR